MYTPRNLIVTAALMSLTFGCTDKGDDTGDGVDTDDTDTDQEANNAPTATDDFATTFAGVMVAIPVRTNDTDPDGDALKITEVVQPERGFAAIAGTSIEYTPNDAVWTGTESFDYTISDEREGGTDVGTVTVNVTELPTLIITSPEDGDTITGDTVRIEFEVNGCTFTSPNSASDGCHGHKFVDGAGWEDDGGSIGHYNTSGFDVTPLDAGSHEFTFVLIKNDGSDAPFSPEISDTVTFDLVAE